MLQQTQVVRRTAPAVGSERRSEAVRIVGRPLAQLHAPLRTARVPARLSSRAPNEQLASVRLRLLQAEEQLRSGQWRKAQEYLIAARILLDRSETTYAPALSRGGLTLHQKQRLQLHIEQHLNRRITLTELAQLVGFSNSHFCRVFADGFGQPPLAYVRVRRVVRSKELITSSTLPLALIAVECGLADQAAFSKLFRRITGESPAAWRRGQRT